MCIRDRGYEIASEVPVGVMVEVPSTIWVLDQILAEVDFISVGTNDLVQYLLAVDRDNPLVSKLYEPYHPAVIRALSSIATQARAAGKPCTVCGEIAGESAFALLLMGMGYSGVSLAPHFLAEVRFGVRNSSLEGLQGLVRQALKADGPGQIRSLLGDLVLELDRA